MNIRIGKHTRLSALIRRINARRMTERARLEILVREARLARTARDMRSIVR
jgi:hypothetical protein